MLGLSQKDIAIILVIALGLVCILIPLFYNTLRHLDEIFRIDETSRDKDRRMKIYKPTVYLFLTLSLVSFNIFPFLRDSF